MNSIMKSIIVCGLLWQLTFSRDPFYFNAKVRSIGPTVILPRLEGVSIDSQGESLAIIHHGQKQLVVQKGEQVGNWNIKSISHDHAVLEDFNGNLHTIALHLDED